MSPRLLIVLTFVLLSYGQEESEEIPSPMEDNNISANDTATEEEANFEFPEPHLQVELMVEAAKEIGGTRRDGWRTVSVFLGRVLTSDQKKEIMARRKELYKIFGAEIGIPTKKVH